MFPVQLMTVRKSRNGTVRSVFLTEENSDYCSAVMELFKSHAGSSREEIEKDIKILELKIQNPKIIRGLALIMFRLSKMVPPGNLDAELVRSTIFKYSKVPPVSPEGREEILSKVAEELNSTVNEISKSMYADKENEQILEAVPEISSDELSKKFNIEQIETVTLKCLTMTVKMKEGMNRIVRKARSLGLLYTLESGSAESAITLSGPLMIKEHSERYGYKFALLVRFLMKLQNWEMDAKVNLKSIQGKAEYNYHLDSSVSEYTGNVQEISHGIYNKHFREDPEPVEVTGNQIYADYSLSLGNKEIMIMVTRPNYYEDDYSIMESIRKAGHEGALFCIVDSGQKCPKGANCMKSEFNYTDAYEFLHKKYEYEERKRKSIEPLKEKNEVRNTKKLGEDMINHLRNLYPDSSAMVDYLEFMGFSPAEALIEAGYEVKWHGLRIEVKK